MPSWQLCRRDDVQVCCPVPHWSQRAAPEKPSLPALLSAFVFLVRGNTLVFKKNKSLKIYLYTSMWLTVMTRKGFRCVEDWQLLLF